MTTLANGGESPNLSRGAKKANPNAVLAKEKKAATQLGVIVGKSRRQYISFVDIYEICYHIYIIYVCFCIVFMHAPSRGIFYFCLSEEQWPFILMFSHATHASSK